MMEENHNKHKRTHKLIWPFMTCFLVVFFITKTEAIEAYISNLPLIRSKSQYVCVIWTFRVVAQSIFQWFLCGVEIVSLADAKKSIWGRYGYLFRALNVKIMLIACTFEEKECDLSIVFAEENASLVEKNEHEARSTLIFTHKRHTSAVSC